MKEMEIIKNAENGRRKSLHKKKHDNQHHWNQVGIVLLVFKPKKHSIEKLALIDAPDSSKDTGKRPYQ